MPKREKPARTQSNTDIREDHHATLTTNDMHRLLREEISGTSLGFNIKTVGDQNDLSSSAPIESD